MTKAAHNIAAHLGGAIARAGGFGAVLEGICYLTGLKEECELCVKDHHFIVAGIIVIFLLFSGIVWDAKRLALEVAYPVDSGLTRFSGWT